MTTEGALYHAGELLKQAAKMTLDQGQVPNPALAILRGENLVCTIIGRTVREDLDERYGVAFAEMGALLQATRGTAAAFVAHMNVLDVAAGGPIPSGEPSDDPASRTVLGLIRFTRADPPRVRMLPYHRGEFGRITFGEEAASGNHIGGEAQVFWDVLRGLKPPLFVPAEVTAAWLVALGHQVMAHRGLNPPPAFGEYLKGPIKPDPDAPSPHKPAGWSGYPQQEGGER